MRKRLQAMMPGLRAALPNAQDVHIYGGALLLAVGAGAVYLPAGLAVAGLALLLLGLLPMILAARGGH
jgi:putative exporter of polyketide antibiotics